MNEAERIARALKGRKSGAGWVCSRPSLSHQGQDKNPSLSLSDGKDGKLLVCCHKGCTFSDVMAALRTRGLIEDERPHVSTADIIAGMAARSARPPTNIFDRRNVYAARSTD
jgi:putative DNA primase/helicase